jgi:uncharacterized membrane protein
MAQATTTLAVTLSDNPTQTQEGVMPDITITLTDTQLKGLEYAALSPQEWAENAVITRCRIANDEIVDLTVKHCLDNGIQVPATREAIVAYAFDNDIVATAAERQAEVEALEAP